MCIMCMSVFILFKVWHRIPASIGVFCEVGHHQNDDHRHEDTDQKWLLTSASFFHTW